MNRRNTVRIAAAVVLASMAMAVVLSGRGVETASERDRPYAVVARGAIRHVRALGPVLRAGRHVGRQAGRDQRRHGVDPATGQGRHRDVCEARHPALQAQAGVRAGMGAARQRGRRTLRRRSPPSTTTASRCTIPRSATTTPDRCCTATWSRRSWTPPRAEGLRVGFYHSVIDWHHDQYEYARSKQLPHPLRGHAVSQRHARSPQVPGLPVTAK